MRVKIATDVVLYATEFTASHTAEMLEAFTKDSMNFIDREPVSQDVTLSGSFLYSDAVAAGEANYEEIFDAILAETALAIEWGDDVVGQPNWSGSFYVSSLELSANADGWAEGSYEFLINGLVTKGTQA